MPVNYFLIGHISKDVVLDEPSGYRLGGGVLYSGIAASVLGAKVAILTSFPKELKKDVAGHDFLKKFKVKNLSSARATTFQNFYEDGKRTQYLLETANPITAVGLVKAGLRKDGVPSIVQLAPIAREIDDSLFDGLRSNFMCATLQGWLRKRDLEDRVVFCAWNGYQRILPKFDAVVLSEEDIDSDDKLAKEYARHSNVLVLTRGKKGCTVFSKGKAKDFKQKNIVDKNDATGAGDVFAAGYFTKLYHTKDPFWAAEFANKLAAFHIEKGIASL